MYPNDVDDVDILFARLEPAPPPTDLHDRVLAGAEMRSRRRHLLGYVLLTVSVLVAASISFNIGQQLQLSGALALLAFLGDLDLLSDSLAEVLLAAFELTPWPLAALVAASLAMTIVAVRLALSPSVHFRSRDAGH